MKELYEKILHMCLNEIKQNGESAITTIINCDVPKQVMLIYYNTLQNKLESIPADEKKLLWEEIYKMFPTKSTAQRWEVCKIIHTIGEKIK